MIPWTNLYSNVHEIHEHLYIIFLLLHFSLELKCFIFNEAKCLPRLEVSTASGSDAFLSDTAAVFMIVPIEVDLRIVPYMGMTASSLRP